MAPGQRRFRATVMIVAAPAWLIVWGAFSGIMLADQGGRTFGIVLGLVWMVVFVSTLRTPYVAVLQSDGSLTFRSLTRSLTTRLDAIHRVRLIRGRAVRYVFYFADRSASLGWGDGKALYRFVVDQNPEVLRE